MPGPSSILNRFTDPTRRWFSGAFPAPTPAQEGAWRAIADGENTLVIAPTGSGKTLSAFLWALDTLAARPERSNGTRVLYISPLKALAVDVERNLRAPLAGITRASQELGVPEPAITVGVRSGDTPAAQRRLLAKTPPDILITTPESLYLMLTSSAREALTTVETVIVDEVHAVAGTKRGTHLALSLERLDELLDSPAQRIGLSATVRPPELVAEFLSGSRPCTIVRPKASKTFDLRVDVPVPDMANIPPPPDAPDSDELDDAFSPTAGSLWPYVEASIVDLIETNRTTIVFANSRRLAERLTARLNEIHEQRTEPGREPPDEGISADAGHGVHPNYVEKFDPNNHPLLNAGPLLKINANQRYASDAVGGALWRRVCRAAEVPTQDFVSSNAVPCGTTIGPLTATRLGIVTVDVGVPLLSMHSSRELAGTADLAYLSRALKAYWNESMN